jgi:hypothetical protein
LGNSSKVSKGSSRLTALIEKTPGYAGGSTPLRTSSISCNEDGSFLFHIDADGLDSVSCKIAIYNGVSCDNMGAAYYNGLFDPWSTLGENYYKIDSSDSTISAFNFDNGYTCDENEGKVVVVFDYSLAIVGCGVLGAEAKGNVLKAKMDVLYPGYTGDLKADGDVKVTFNDDNTFQFGFDIKGVEADCVDCGIHIHVGTTCATHAEVGGHYWKQDVLRDLWKTIGGAVYNADDKGKAKGYFSLYNGYGIKENNNHVVVIHAQDGTRVACGVLTL